jgi:dipeptidyl aminopeptidase/acylaminoacyl peptidase
MRKLTRILLVLCTLYLIFSVIGGVIVGEGSLKLRHRPLTHRQEAAALVHDRYHAELQEVSVTAADAITLNGWYVHPEHFNGNVVMLLHGITDNREGMAGFAKLFLDHGYAVLLPDARAHGESGGELATYGVKESDDIHRWVSWIYGHDSPHCVYGLGESYGAGLLLQALADEPRFCAVVVESAFSTAREISYERASGFLHLGSWFGRTLGRPIIASAVEYARLRYNLDLLEPSPLDGIRNSRVPVLLIHGANDRNISPRHSIILAGAAPDRVQLWLVPNAGHTMAWAAAHQEFEARILGWFEEKADRRDRRHRASSPSSPSSDHARGNTRSASHESG